MALLTREQILAAPDLQPETVHVPEWGGDVLVRAWTAEERDAWERSMIGKSREEIAALNSRARFFARCVLDEQGRPLFTEADFEQLAQKSAAAMDHVIRVARRLNGLDSKGVEEAKGN